MKIAFLIMAHAHPELLERLIRRLQSRHASIYVHLDCGTKMAAFKRLFVREGILNVHWVPRVRSSWGTFGQVQASLSLLNEAMTTDKEAGMFVLLSGVDYPLHPPEQMQAFFEERKGVSFISCNRMPWSVWTDNGGFDRLRHWHFGGGRRQFYLEYPSEQMPRALRLQLLYRLCGLFLPKTRSLPSNLTSYGGSSWWNLTRDMCERILDGIRRNPSLLKTFRFTRSSDEIFYQTLVMNSVVGALESDDLRCAFWDGRRNEYPAFARMEDFGEIKNSGKLFMRKVHPQYSLDLLDRIDRDLLGV